MKKLFLVGVLALFGVVNAQHFGVNAGFLSLNAKVKLLDMRGSETKSGYYVGLFGEFGNEKFKFQPAVNLIGNEDGNALQIPLIAKFYVADKFNLQAGPQLMFDLEEVPEGFNALNFGLGLGLGYDINNKFLLEARYSIQLNNHLENSSSNYSAKINYLSIGLGYRLK